MTIGLLHRLRFGDPARVAAEPDWARYEAALGAARVDKARARLKALLASWSQLFFVPEADFVRELDLEDFVENAIWLTLAAQIKMPLRVLGRDDAVLLEHRGPRSFCFLGHGRRIGSERVFAPADGDLRSGRAYWRSPVLREAMGRHTRVCAGDPDGETGYCAAARALFDEGVSRILVKIVFQDKYQGLVALSDPDRIEAEMLAGFSYNILDCHGRAEAFLLQEAIPMRHEYRIFVVGRRPVAGAGCIEMLSPIFCEAQDGFDLLTETVRGEGDIAERPDEVARMRAFAVDLCERLEGQFTDFVLDLAIDARTGRPVVVETNPLVGSGLYALDARKVLDAIAMQAWRARRAA